ncbi:MAG: M24 family metallopeptidase [Candidatus Aminicenantes bacterium]|nr:M24 family metallopeptidase [Candidatus Aminicenantes bacterium]
MGQRFHLSSKIIIVLLWVVIFTWVAYALFSQDFNWEMSCVGDINNILSPQKQAEIYNQILVWRLDNILPTIMRREGLELWLIICFEYAEDPIYRTLVVQPIMSARRLSILLFHDDPQEGFKKLTANWHGTSTCGPIYTNIFTEEYRKKGAEGQLLAVADYIKKKKPKNIGLNTAFHWEYFDDFSHGLGLSAFFKAKLEQTLGPELNRKIVSAEKVCIGWLETRSPQEISLYRHVVGLGHDLIREFFSNQVIIPDVTTTEEVVWWIRKRLVSLGLEAWFQPSIEIIRSPEKARQFDPRDKVIRRGDVLHCDVGFRYLGLATDMQHLAYVCELGEEDAPAGLKELLRKGNRLQEILMSEFKEGRTGNEILRSALKKGQEEGLNPRIYSHAIGFYGHGSGMTIGMVDKQEYVPGTGNHPLYPNTVYSIELSVTGEIPEWNMAKITFGLEDEAVFTKEGCRWIDGYPRTFYLIK